MNNNSAFSVFVYSEKKQRAESGEQRAKPDSGVRGQGFLNSQFIILHFY